MRLKNSKLCMLVNFFSELRPHFLSTEAQQHEKNEKSRKQVPIVQVSSCFFCKSCKQELRKLKALSTCLFWWTTNLWWHAFGQGKGRSKAKFVIFLLFCRAQQSNCSRQWWKAERRCDELTFFTSKTKTKWRTRRTSLYRVLITCTSQYRSSMSKCTINLLPMDQYQQMPSRCQSRRSFKTLGFEEAVEQQICPRFET